MGKLHVVVAHAAHSRGTGSATSLLRLGLVYNQGFGGQNQTCNRCSILNRASRYLCRINDAGLQQVDDLTRYGVEAKVLSSSSNSLNDDRTLVAGILCDLSKRLFESSSNDQQACELVSSYTFD